MIGYIFVEYDYSHDRRILHLSCHLDFICVCLCHSVQSVTLLENSPLVLLLVFFLSELGWLDGLHVKKQGPVCGV